MKTQAPSPTYLYAWSTSWASRMGKEEDLWDREVRITELDDNVRIQ